MSAFCETLEISAQSEHSRLPSFLVIIEDLPRTVVMLQLTTPLVIDASGKAVVLIPGNGTSQR
jgi:hypothetical protein